MNVHAALRPSPPKLPDTVSGALSHRRLKQRPTLNDEIESLMLSAWEDEQFQSYLDAVYDEQAVEGSLSIDNAKAAELLRDKAIKTGSRVGQEKLATIVKSLNVVLRRYGFSRNERRNLVAGKVVNPEI
jgi:hypothetical protein